MAMIQCPECGKDISDKAYACPHCGYPVKPVEEKTEYRLLTGKLTSQSEFTSFLKILAVIMWIGGLILAIIGGRTIMVTPRGQIDYQFSFPQFLTILLTYILYGVLTWCFANVIDEIKQTHAIVSGLRLENGTKETAASNSATSNSKPSYLSKTPGTNHEWRCKKCGSMNPPASIYCRDCGTYK